MSQIEELEHVVDNLDEDLKDVNDLNQLRFDNNKSNENKKMTSKCQKEK